MSAGPFLESIPPLVVYLTVAVVIGVESLGIPLPGEIVLVSASLLAARGIVNPWWLAAAAATGAIIGDSIGYGLGHRYGMSVFDRLGRRFPRHAGPKQIAFAERFFHRWGMWAVFFGRFIALLRILAGPMAGAVRMPYKRFLVANALGGIAWAAGTVALIYALGLAAEQWLQRFSWVGLVAALVVGGVVFITFQRRLEAAVDAVDEADPSSSTERIG